MTTDNMKTFNLADNRKIILKNNKKICIYVILLLLKYKQ